MYRNGTFALEFSGGDGRVLLVAQWPVDTPAAEGHRYRVAQLDVFDGSDAEALELVRDAQPVRLFGQSEWRAFLQSLFADIAPEAQDEAALVPVQNQDVVVHRAPDGSIKAYQHEHKPPGLRVARAWTEQDFAARANVLLEKHHGPAGRVAFAAGDVDGPESYVFFDFPGRQSVMIAPIAEAGPLAPGVPLGFALSLSDALLVRSHLLTPVTRPVTSATRLAWLATQSASSAVPQALHLPPGDPGPLAASGSMDLAAWEQQLDDLVSSRRYRGSMVPLIDGEAFFTTLVQSIQDARESVTIRLYIFDRDEYALRIADLLKRRSREVRVRILLDHIGTLAAGLDQPANHAFRATRPDAPSWIAHFLETDSDIDVRIASNPWLTSDHTKSIVIDGRRAFVGGMNIGYEYRYEWHDMMVQVEGPIVGRLAHDFERFWAHAGPAGDLGFAAASAAAEEYRGDADRPDYMDIRPLYTRTGNLEILRAQLAATRAARSYIYVQQPYVSDDAIVGALVQARHRGVDVRVILPTRSDSGFMNSANLIAASVFLRNGIRVYAYPGMTHLKAAIYDGWATLGSANFDKLSLRINQETNLATSDPRFVDRLRRDVFERDFARAREMKEPPDLGWGAYISEFIADQL
ncbi:MAG TPA: phosphatidylserine/phosphatidylglycerophosphate/cardiolipin synthase family protein [Burkholderiales bacterium]|nr:phosphatidylserine/phosphatidylglycerophosphate/cardiolipin synthase family protein [Burkholderiales bacterium]